MARLIQDIAPEPGRQPQRMSNQAIQRIHQVHQATNIPNLIDASQHRVSSFDVVRPRPVKRPVTQRQPGPVKQKVVTKKPSAKPKATAKPTIWRRLADFAQYPLIAIIAIAAAYNSTAGQLIVLAFALICIILRLQSRYSFGCALLLLICVPFFQAIKQTGISQNAAIYAYELLVVGTILAIIELWRDNRRQISE